MLNRIRLQALSNLITEQAKNLSLTKGHDYATQEDVIDNFKKQTIICEALELDDSPKAQAVRLLIVKLIRIANLWKKDTPKNESIVDSIVDGVNYFILSEACRLDELGIDNKLIAQEVEDKYANKDKTH